MTHPHPASHTPDDLYTTPPPWDIGTGEHALLCAERGLAVRFLRGEARRLAEWSESFDTVLDCGLFHVFGEDDLTGLVESARSVLVAGGRHFLLCLSEEPRC